MVGSFVLLVGTQAEEVLKVRYNLGDIEIALDD